MGRARGDLHGHRVDVFAAPESDVLAGERSTPVNSGTVLKGLFQGRAGVVDDFEPTPWIGRTCRAGCSHRPDPRKGEERYFGVTESEVPAGRKELTSSLHESGRCVPLERAGVTGSIGLVCARNLAQRGELDLGPGHRAVLDLRRGDRVVLDLLGADAVLAEVRSSESRSTAHSDKQRECRHDVRVGGTGQEPLHGVLLCLGVLAELDVHLRPRRQDLSWLRVLLLDLAGFRTDPIGLPDAADGAAGVAQHLLRGSELPSGELGHYTGLVAEPVGAARRAGARHRRHRDIYRPWRRGGRGYSDDLGFRVDREASRDRAEAHRAGFVEVVTDDHHRGAALDRPAGRGDGGNLRGRLHVGVEEDLQVGRCGSRRPGGERSQRWSPQGERGARDARGGEMAAVFIVDGDQVAGLDRQVGREGHRGRAGGVDGQAVASSRVLAAACGPQDPQRERTAVVAGESPAHDRARDRGGHIGAGLGERGVCPRAAQGIAAGERAEVGAGQRTADGDDRGLRPCTENQGAKSRGDQDGDPQLHVPLLGRWHRGGGSQSPAPRSTRCSVSWPSEGGRSPGHIAKAASRA